MHRGEYAAGENFSSRDFPALSTRMPRRKLQELTGVDGMYHLNGFLLIRQGDLTYTPDSGGRAGDPQRGAGTGAENPGGHRYPGADLPDKQAFDTADHTLTALGLPGAAGATPWR